MGIPWSTKQKIDTSPPLVQIMSMSTPRRKHLRDVGTEIWSY